jgi:hypothetical protein
MAGYEAASAVTVGHHRGQFYRTDATLEPQVLTAVSRLAVKEFFPEPGRGRVRRVLVDGLGVEAAHRRPGRDEQLPGRSGAADDVSGIEVIPVDDDGRGS